MLHEQLASDSVSRAQPEEGRVRFADRYRSQVRVHALVLAIYGYLAKDLVSEGE